jgi:hypothetical protein
MNISAINLKRKQVIIDNRLNHTLPLIVDNNKFI